MPLLVTQNSKEALKQQAIAILMNEMKKGEESVIDKSDLVNIGNIAEEFGVNL